MRLDRADERARCLVSVRACRTRAVVPFYNLNNTNGVFSRAYSDALLRKLVHFWYDVGPSDDWGEWETESSEVEAALQS